MFKRAPPAEPMLNKQGGWTGGGRGWGVGVMDYLFKIGSAGAFLEQTALPFPFAAVPVN
jgi:hypothetical protein